MTKLLFQMLLGLLSVGGIFAIQTRSITHRERSTIAVDRFTQQLGTEVQRPTATLPQDDNEAIFSIVGGRVVVASIIGEVTTAIQNQANNTKLIYDPEGAGANTDLCADLDIANLAIGVQLAITGTLADAMVSGVRRSLLQATPHVLEDGDILLNCAAENAGAIKWSIFYFPIDRGARIVAA